MFLNCFRRDGKRYCKKHRKRRCVFDYGNFVIVGTDVVAFLPLPRSRTYNPLCGRLDTDFQNFETLRTDKKEFPSRHRCRYHRNGTDCDFFDGAARRNFCNRRIAAAAPRFQRFSIFTGGFVCILSANPGSHGFLRIFDSVGILFHARTEEK